MSFREGGGHRISSAIQKRRFPLGLPPHCITLKRMTATANTLTKKQVQAAKDNIYRLDLPTFEAVEEDAFAALSTRKHYLNLSGLKSLSEEQAKVLAQHPGILQLDGLTEISESVAEILAAKKGGLWLNGLTTLSDAAATALSKHLGDLYLRGLKVLTPAAQKSLSKTNIFFVASQIKAPEQK